MNNSIVKKYLSLIGAINLQIVLVRKLQYQKIPLIQEIEESLISSIRSEPQHSNNEIFGSILRKLISCANLRQSIVSKEMHKNTELLKKAFSINQTNYKKNNKTQNSKSKTSIIIDANF